MQHLVNKDVLRSLLQKSIRRGSKSLTISVAYKLAELDDSRWIKSRVGTIIFEECWQRSNMLTNTPFDIIEVLKSITISAKQKDAAGLGTLGYYLSLNDLSTLDFSPDFKAVKIVAAGVKRPKDFFNWAVANSSKTNKDVIYKIHDYHNLASWPWDKAFAVAAAYLHISNASQFVDETKEMESFNFPYWVAIDKHTREGKNKLLSYAKTHNLNYDLLVLASFYFEGASVNILSPSLWWEQEINWNCKRFNTTKDELQIIWSNVRDQIKNNLLDTSLKLYANFNTISDMDTAMVLI